MQFRRVFQINATNLLKRIAKLEAGAHSGCITLTMPDNTLRQITGKRLIEAGAERGRGVWKQDAVWCRESVRDDGDQQGYAGMVQFLRITHRAQTRIHEKIGYWPWEPECRGRMLAHALDGSNCGV